MADMALVSVNAAELEDRQYERIKELPLGNSYGVRQGDLVVAIGSRPV